MLTKVVTLEYFFISYKKWATELYIGDRKYFTNLHNSAQRRHMLAIQSTDMGVLQKIFICHLFNADRLVWGKVQELAATRLH